MSDFDEDLGAEPIKHLLFHSGQKAGYTVPTDRARTIYSITEIYAGKASDFKPESSSSGSYAASGLSLVTSIAACVALHSCANTGVIGNGVSGTIASGSINSDSTGSLQPSSTQAANLVVHKVCLPGMGCASSAATSNDPSVTLAKLKEMNASERLPKSIRLMKYMIHPCRTRLWHTYPASAKQRGEPRLPCKCNTSGQPRVRASHRRFE